MDITDKPALESYSQNTSLHCLSGFLPFHFYALSSLLITFNLLNLEATTRFSTYTPNLARRLIFRVNDTYGQNISCFLFSNRLFSECNLIGLKVTCTVLEYLSNISNAFSTKFLFGPMLSNFL